MSAQGSAEHPIRFRPTLKGLRPDPASRQEVEALLGQEPRRRDLLIEHLHKIQDAYGHLAHRHLVALADLMRLSMAEVFEVATFYHHFDVVREGERAPAALTVRVCESLSCEMAGARDLLQRLPEILGASVRVIPAPCVGRCEQAPVAVVGQHPVVCATTQRVAQQVAQQVAGAHAKHPLAADTGCFNPVDLAQPSGSLGVVHEVSPAYVGYDAYCRNGGYALAQRCIEGQMPLEEVLQRMEHSGLRGLGGAGFPTGRKWRLVRAEPGPRLMAVNIDEGEPGTFKDRTYLERDPHRFLEGLIIAAWAVQAQEVYIYLRDEYHGCRELLARELQRLNQGATFSLPTLHLRRGAGAYICGEESAMIESIEGKRGMPRLRPPYVAQRGLFGRSTLEQNMETLYWVRDILERGPQWFAGQGRHGRKGLRSFSVSGRVRRPGVHLAPAGITVRELIDEYCGGMLPGHTFYAYLPGGASGGILPASMGDVPLDFDTLQPHGCFIGSAAVIVLSQQDRARDAALNMMNFFRHESCGQCTPCRSGTAKMTELMQSESSHPWDEPLMNELAQVMIDASICGLGQAAPNPVLCVMKYFPHELQGGRP